MVSRRKNEMVEEFEKRWAAYSAAYDADPDMKAVANAFREAMKASRR